MSAGVVAIFVAKGSDIDWASVTVASDEVSTWAFTGATKFVELEPERRPTILNIEYTRDNAYYDVKLEGITFNGKSTAQTLAIANLKECCDLVFVVYYANGASRVIGKEHISGEFVNPVKNAKVSRHLDSAGEFGGGEDNGARDVVDVLAQHQQPPVYTSIDLATMRSTYV